MLRPAIRPYCKNNGSDERALAFCDSIFRSIFFATNAYWGFDLLWQTDLLPPSMGGQGDFLNVMINVPFKKGHDGFLEYSIFSLAFYVSDFFTTVIRNTDSNDFWEMLLHHIVTICLFAGMLHSNHIHIGVVVSALHSASDVLLTLSRAFS